MVSDSFVSSPVPGRSEMVSTVFGNLSWEDNKGGHASFNHQEKEFEILNNMDSPLINDTTSGKDLNIVSEGGDLSTDHVSSSHLPNCSTSWFLMYLVIPSMLLLIICFLWEKYCVSLRDKSSPLPLPNGRMGFPFVGEMFHFLFLGVKFQRARRHEFGPIYRTHLFGRPTIRVSGEKHIRKLLLGEGQLVETKWPYTTQVILGSDGIVNGSKETHTTIKRLTLRALSPRFMETYAPTVQRSVARHIAEWNRKGEFPILEECKQLIAKTMMTVLLGVNEDDPDIQMYIEAADNIINSILCIPINTPSSAWKKGQQAREFIFEQMKTRLKAKMESSDEDLFGEPGFSASDVTSNVDEIAASKGHGDSVLVNIIKIARLEKESTIKLKNLQNLALEIIFAGTQSLQASSSLLILHLSQHKKVLEKLQQEIFENGMWDTPLEEIPYRKINSLRYASHVVNEVLRVTPPIPGAVRRATKTFELGGFQIPKGWQVMFSIRETHEMASGQEKQEKPLESSHLDFDPSYFACEKCKYEIPFNKNHNDVIETSQERTNHNCHAKNGSFSFIPFSKGARMCAGVNYALFVLRVLAIEIARTSEFHATTPIKLMSIPMTKPARSVKVSFRERKNRILPDKNT